MAKEYRYWWLKLEKDFFNRKFMKKLRRLDNGAVYTIIYLKMQLESLQNGGVLSFQKTEDTFEEELAFVIDEDLKDTIETVKFLKKYGLLVELTETANELELTEVVNNIDSEGASAKRMRRKKERDEAKKKEESSKNDGVASIFDAQSSQSDGNDVNLLRREREEKEKYKETEKRESKAYQPTTTSAFSETSVSVSSPSLLCGTFGNVSLTQVQLDWLKEYYPADYMKKIENMSTTVHKFNNPAPKDHFKKIIEWLEQDEKKNLGKTAAPAGRGCDLESESKRPIPPKPDNVDMTDEEWKIHIEKLRE